MTKSTAWEIVTSSTSVTDGQSFRMKAPGGWLFLNKATSTSTNTENITFIPDLTGAWTTPTLAWEKLTLSSSSTINSYTGTLYRAKVPGGWLVGTALTSSARDIIYIADAAGTWLLDLIIPTVNSISNFNLTVGTAFSFTPTVNNPSNLALSFGLSGTLPAGLSFNTSTGAISGTPTTAANAQLQIQVLSTAGNSASNAFNVSVVQPVILQSIDNIADQSVANNVAFSFTPTVTNPSNLALTFTLNGILPAGLTFNAQNGAISGASTVAGTTSFTIVVTSSAGPVTSNSFTITIAAAVVANGKWIGTNLMPVADWSTDFPFLNNIQKSRAWISGTWNAWDDGRALNLDAQGNVLSLIGNGSDQQAKTVVFSNTRPAGNYVLTWTGSGSLAWTGASVISQTTNQMVVSVPASGNVVLTILAVDAVNPIKNLSLVRQDQSTLTGLFNPDFLNDMKKYRCIRFMDWQCTNFSRTAASMSKDFAPLTNLPIRFTENATSVPVEVMIELCNEAKTDGWFCMPMQATDAYIDQFIALVKAKLDPSLTAYFEHSNEVWNGGFPQNQLQGGATFTDKMNLHALATSKIAAKVKAALGSRGLTAFGAQSPNLGTQDSPLAYLVSQNAPLPDLLATAPYFGYGLPDDPVIFTDGRLNTSIQGVVNEVTASKGVANKYGMSLVCYEGGSTVMPGVVVNRDSRMGTAYVTYLHGIKAANPGKLFNHYAYISGYDSSGSWGEREYQYQAATGKSTGIATVINEG